MNGWKIKPQEADHTLTVSDGILLVNGGGDPFNDTVGAYVVRINYQQPVQAISFTSEGAVTPEDVATAVLDAMLEDHDDPGTVGKGIANASSAGDPWATLMAGYTDDATFGAYIKKLLSTGAFLALK